MAKKKAKKREITLQEMEEFFKSYEFTDDIIELNQCTTVTNIKTLVTTHIAALKANTGNKTLMPYYNRLLTIYKLLNLKWNQKKST